MQVKVSFTMHTEDHATHNPLSQVGLGEKTQNAKIWYNHNILKLNQIQNYKLIIHNGLQ